MKIERYPAYKNSGVEWLGDVPEHWKLQRLKDIKANIPNSFVDGPFGSNLKTEHFIENGEVYVIDSGYITSGQFEIKRKFKTISNEHFLTVNRSQCSQNDIIISKIGANFGMSGILPLLDKPSLISGNTLKLTINRKLYNLKFIHYQLLNLKINGAFDVLVKGSAQPALSMGLLNPLPFPTPPLPEQELIAHYLDTKTGQIDRKIDLLTQKAALYGDLKQSLINETVTRGLDKSVPVKDSGIEWLSEVPYHWKSGRLKDIISALESGVSVNAANLPAQTNESGILKTSCVSISGFNPNENKTILEEEIVRAKCNPRKGNIIISRMNTPELVGASGFVDKDYPNLFLPDRLWQTVFYCNAKINSKWLSYLLIVTRFREVVSFSATGSSPSMKNLSQENFLQIAIPLPSVSEQKAIADYLDAKTAQIDQIIQTINTQIEKLKELRKTLINDVVTGKIKVV